MDYGEMDTVKLEKMKAMKKFRRNRKAKKYLRYALVALSAVVLSWSSVWIPVVLQTTAFYFRFACNLVTSSRFIFIMCNVIIITLAAKSGQLSSSSGTPNFYDEYVKSSENRQKNVVNYSLSEEKEEEEEVEKHCISEEPVADPLPPSQEEIKSVIVEEVAEDINIKPEVAGSSHRKIARSQSEKTEKRRGRILRRSETDIENIENHCLLLVNSKSVSSEMAVVEVSSPEMVVDNVELEKKCDEFIAKRKKFQRQESRLAMVN